jgi:hypothetical protein
MFGKWEVRELVYQINFLPFPTRFDKGRTIRHLMGGGVGQIPKKNLRTEKIPKKNRAQQTY